MSWFTFKESKKVNVFANTNATENHLTQGCVEGTAYEATKGLQPSALRSIIVCEIERTIAAGQLPEMQFSVTIEREKPTPIFRIVIEHIDGPIVHRLASFAEAEIYWEDSSIGRMKLTDLAHYVREKLMQIVWKYNADTVLDNSAYGQTHFCYQVVFSPDLIERQVIANSGSQDSAVNQPTKDTDHRKIA